MNILDQAYKYELYLNNLILKNNLNYTYPEIIEEEDQVIIEYGDELYFIITNSSEIFLNDEIAYPSDKNILDIWKRAM